MCLAEDSPKVIKGIATESQNFVITEDESLWGWGSNVHKELANISEWYIEQPIRLLDNVKDIHASFCYITVLKEDGSVWIFGECPIGDEYMNR